MNSQSPTRGSASAPIAPVYLICGDDPLLVSEASDAVRARARDAGYGSREVHFIERGFDWAALLSNSRTLSLFAERQLVELRLSQAPDAAAAKALAELVADTVDDRVLLIVGPKLDRRQAGAQWVMTVDKRGTFQQIWPIDTPRLPNWVRERLTQQGFDADTAVAAMIADRVEGNLLAAHQEIVKLALLRAPGKLTAEEVLESVADSARYDTLQLGEAAMRGQRARALKILAGLRSEGVEAVLILWGLNKDLQWMARADFLVRTGQSVDSAMNSIGVWRPRQAAMKIALGRLKTGEIRGLILDASRTDRAIKGALRRDPWNEMQALVARLAGVRLPRTRAA